MNEEWRAVEGWPYEVSNHGRVRRSEGYMGVTRRGYVMKQKIDRYGYPVVELQNAGDRCWPAVHRLVARAFLGQPPTDTHQVNHKDGDKANNHPDNLEWVTPAENQQHASRLGLMTPTVGEINGCSKLTREEVLEIRRRYKGGGVSQYELAEEYGVSQSNVSMVVNNVTWKCAA